MLAIFFNNICTLCFGNIEFSETVYQTAESLTEEQREEFNVYTIVDAYPELMEDYRYNEIYTYEIDGRNLIRTCGQSPIPVEEINQRKEEKINALWSAAYHYNENYISGVAIGLLAIGVFNEYPKCLAVRDWHAALWDDYYARKALITYSSELNLDFSNHGDMPYTVPELRLEVGM